MRPRPTETRRTLILTSGIIGAGLLLGGCDNRGEGSSTGPLECRPKQITADEDLLREHGILRRALLVYAESAARLRRNPASLPADALRQTAILFRRFGEDYHERTLEEQFVFPAVRQAGGSPSLYVDVLVAQHNRGREITDFILRIIGQNRIVAAAGPLAQAIGSYVWMYENHAAREDTVIFPAWKDALSGPRYLELADQFQRLEWQTFGEDGFRDAVDRVARIEEAFGMTDLAQFTAPPPPNL